MLTIALVIVANMVNLKVGTRHIGILVKDGDSVGEYFGLIEETYILHKIISWWVRIEGSSWQALLKISALGHF